MADLPQGRPNLFDQEDVQNNDPYNGLMMTPRDLPLGRSTPYQAVMTDTPSMKDGAPGMVEHGNIDLQTRPIVSNPDGSTSSVYSSSFHDGNHEVLIPQVADGGVILTMPKAIEQYRLTGKHLGKFATPQAADAYATTLHNDYASGKIKGYADESQEPLEGYDLNRIHRGISRGFTPQGKPGGLNGTSSH